MSSNLQSPFAKDFFSSSFESQEDPENVAVLIQMEQESVPDQLVVNTRYPLPSHALLEMQAIAHPNQNANSSTLTSKTANLTHALSPAFFDEFQEFNSDKSDGISSNRGLHTTSRSLGSMKNEDHLFQNDLSYYTAIPHISADGQSQPHETLSQKSGQLSSSQAFLSGNQHEIQAATTVEENGDAQPGVLIKEVNAVASCNICEEKFGSQESLERHMLRRHFESNVQCHICSLKVRSHRNLQIHVRTVHEGSGPKVSCNVDGCSAFFNTKWSLSFHKRKHHGIQTYSRNDSCTGKVYQCPFCQYSSAKRGNVTRHLVSRHGTSSQLRSGYMFECETCHKKFLHDSNRKLHKCSAEVRN